MPWIALAKSQGQAVSAVAVELTRDSAQGLRQVFTWARLGQKFGVGGSTRPAMSVQVAMPAQLVALGEMRIAEVRLARSIAADEWSEGDLRAGSQRAVSAVWCFVSDHGCRWSFSAPGADGDAPDVWVCPLMPWSCIDAHRDGEPAEPLTVVMPHPGDPTLAFIAKPPPPGRRAVPVTIDDDSIWEAGHAVVVNQSFQRRRHRPEVPGSCPACGTLPAALEQAHLIRRRVLSADHIGAMRLGDAEPYDAEAPPIMVLAYCEVCDMRYLLPPGARVDLRKGKT